MTEQQWINLYFFWKLQYELRKNLIKNHKNFSIKRNKLLEMEEYINCKPYKNTIKSWKKPDINYFISLAAPNFPCLNYNNYCSKCRFREKNIQLINKVKEYADVKNSLRNYSYTYEQLILDSTKFLDQLILMKLNGKSGEDFFNDLIHSTPVQREYINEGIKLLGIKNLKKIENRRISGKVIAEIDLSYPASFLCLRIKTLKSLRFSILPTLEKLNSVFKVEDIKDSYKAKVITKDEKDLGLSEASFESRAIGLWLHDVVTTKQYKDFKDAYEALKNGHWHDNNFQQETEISAKVLDILGKGASEEKVIKKLMQKTIACVNNGEVLNLS